GKLRVLHEQKKALELAREDLLTVDTDKKILAKKKQIELAKLERAERELEGAAPSARADDDDTKKDVHTILLEEAEAVLVQIGAGETRRTVVNLIDDVQRQTLVARFATRLGPERFASTEVRALLQ